MKKITYLLTAIVALGCTACSNESEKETPSKGEKTITFEVINYQQVSLDDVTRGTDATALAHLDMAIYNASTNELVSKKQTSKGNDGYGQFSATLAYGQYTVVFLGYDGSRTADMSKPTDIVFTDQYVPNMFYKTVQLTVSAASTDAQSIVLTRGVAAFWLRHEGYIPNTLKAMKITANGGGNHFNALTGFATEVAERWIEFDLTSKAGGTSFGLQFFTFLPAQTATMKFTAVATDTDDKELQTRTFSDVPMKINQRTTYSGEFFGTGKNAQGFNLSLDTDQWDEVNQTY